MDAGASAVASEKDSAVPILPNDAVRGSRVAPATVVVFSDFQCPFCGRLERTFDRLREEYGDAKLRFVFKNQPLPFHEHARLAAEVGQGVLELAGQDAFWRYHARVFGLDTLSAESVRAAAVSAGVEAQALESGIASKRWSAKIEGDERLALRLGVGGTPHSFVNGVAVSGAQPFEKFKAVIDAELAKASALAEQGVAPDQLYTRLAKDGLSLTPPSEDDEDDHGAEDAAAQAVHKVPLGKAPARGPATALVTIIEFSDFQCPYCKRVGPTLERIRADYGDKVRIVWRDSPLPFHPRAEPAAELARAARAQKGDAAFWEVHDLLFSSQPELEDSDLERIARDAKLDVEKAMAAVKAKSFKKGIDEDLDVADDFKASGTPHFFINGHRLVGAQPFERFKPVIEAEIAKAESLVQSGLAPAAVYEATIKGGIAPGEPEKRSIAPAVNAPFRGPANAKIVIQEISDFECPFCKRAEGTIDELLKAYPGKIKVVWRDHPLPFHSHAMLAAEAAREAHAQKGNEGFSRMQKLIFDDQRALERSDLDAHAKTIGLDPARFAAALDAHTHKPAIEADAAASAAAGVSGTPGFFVGPYYLSGAQPFQRFRKLVDALLKTPDVAAAPARTSRP